MRSAIGVVRKHTSKVTLPATVAAGVPKAALPLKDTEFYQIGTHGDYVQENGYVTAHS